MSIKKYSSGQWVDTPYRKYETATDTITSLPKTIIGDGQNISAYTIKGNMTQASQPTPQNPVYPTECGEKTANLFDTFDVIGQVPSVSSGALVNSGNGACTSLIPISSSEITMAITNGTAQNNYYLFLYGDNENYIGYKQITITSEGTVVSTEISGYSSAKYARIRVDNLNSHTTGNFRIMLAYGTTAQSFEPYGYKIPISFGQGTYTSYLAEPIRKINTAVDTMASTGTATRNIKKFVFDGTENDWQVASATVGVRFNIPVPDINESTVNSPKSICSHFYLGTTSTDYGAYNISYAGGSVTRFICKPESTITTVAQLKQWLADQYTAGTPLTLWGILDTAETDTFTAPSIPTSGTAQSFDVDTTLKPSEVSLTYHGWHEHEDTKFTT